MTHQFDVSNTLQIVASRDGQYVAENQATTSGSQTTWTSTVYGPDGSQAGHLNDSIESFSWDSSLAIVDSGYGAGPVSIVNWRDSTIVWTAPAGYTLDHLQPEPGGTSFAVWVKASTQAPSPTAPSDTLYLVTAKGTVLATIRGTS